MLQGIRLNSSKNAPLVRPGKAAGKRGARSQISPQNGKAKNKQALAPKKTAMHAIGKRCLSTPSATLDSIFCLLWLQLAVLGIDVTVMAVIYKCCYKRSIIEELPEIWARTKNSVDKSSGDKAAEVDSSIVELFMQHEAKEALPEAQLYAIASCNRHCLEKCVYQ